MKKKLLKLSRNEKILLVVTAALLAVFIVKKSSFDLSKYHTINSTIEARERLIGNGLLLIDQKDEIARTAGQFNQYLAKDNLTDEKEFTGYLNKVEKIAKKTGISLDTIRPGNAKFDDPVKEYTIEIEFISGVDRLVEFMHRLQSPPDFFNIARLQVNGQEKSSQVKTVMWIKRIAFDR